MRGANRESGGIITGWLLQLGLILAVISLLVYEVVAIGVAAVTVDDTAREVTRVARDAYRADRSVTAAQRTAAAAVDDPYTGVTSLQEVDGDLIVTLHRQARTLLVHRIGPLEDLATATATRRVRWRS